MPLFLTSHLPSDVPGNLTLVDSSGTAGNILKGGTLFLHNYGTNNAGSNAGNLSMTGVSNTGSGATALQNNTSGNYNTALGTGALFSNTNGEGNTASGYHALYANCSPPTPCSGNQGLFNTATGSSALALNTPGWFNTASGALALLNNTTGSYNTASGYQALFSNGRSVGSTAMGYQALYNNCSIIEPCEPNEGYYNTAIGYQALYSNTDGRNNTATGYQALYSNGGDDLTGNFNTANGSGALYSNLGGSFNTAIGAGALGHNCSSGCGMPYRGFYNTGIGAQADVSVANLTNATAIGYSAIVNASNKIRLGNADVSVIEGQVPYTFTSDKNQKENFQPVNAEDVLTKLVHLPVSTWNYMGQDPKQFRHYGPVAQDFFTAFGHDRLGTIGTDTTINSGDMEGILMIAVQALEKRTAELATLKAENADLKARLERLERSVTASAAKAE